MIRQHPVHDTEIYYSHSFVNTTLRICKGHYSSLYQHTLEAGMVWNVYILEADLYNTMPFKNPKYKSFTAQYTNSVSLKVLKNM